MGRAGAIVGAVVAGLCAGAAGAALTLAVQPRGDAEAPALLAGEPVAWRAELDALAARVAAMESRNGAPAPLATAPIPVPPGGLTRASERGDGVAPTAADPAGTAPAGPGAPADPNGAGGAPGPSPVRNAIAVSELAKTLGTLRKRVQRLEDAGADVDVTTLSSDELAQMGVEAIEAKQHTKGLRLLGALLERDPDHPKAAEARLQFGFYGEDDAVAAHHLEEFLARNADHPWHPYGNFYLARRYEKLGDPARAQRTYEAELTTGDANPFFGVHTRDHLAKLAEARGDAAAAERWRREALARYGTCDWGTVTPVLADMRKALGIPEPAPK